MKNNAPKSCVRIECRYTLIYLIESFERDVLPREKEKKYLFSRSKESCWNDLICFLFT